MKFKDKLWFYLLGSQWPQAKGYTVTEGFVSGDRLRCESFDGGEIWLTSKDTDPMSGVYRGRCRGKDGFVLMGFAPFFWGDGKWYSVAPIQKESYYGYLHCSPSARWYWNMRKLQDKDANGNYIPGTEDGFCWRGTPSWRVDFPGTVLDGVLRHWIPSGGHLSFKRYD